VVLDTLGCALRAAGCEPARIAARLQVPGLELAGEAAERATVIGSTAPATLKQAILVNGILNRYLDYGDVYWKRDVPHPSELVTVALGAVEARGGSGRDFIEAVLAGYEAQLRLCDAFSFQAIGMHAASSGGFIAPLVIGRAWKIDPPQLAHAVALNGARHLILFGLAKGELSMAKAIAFPLAAAEAVDACRLAAEGFTGPLSILEWMFENLPHGLEDPAKPRLDLARERYRVEAVTLKRYPVQFEIQGAVEAALKLAAALPAPAVDAIAKVVVSVNPLSKERTADEKKYRPSTRETADHSLPCCVAIALQDRALEVAQFEMERWAAADIARLMGRIEVVGDEVLDATYPGGRPCRVSIRLNDGRELSEFVAVPLGDAKRAMPPAEVERKFAELASHVLSVSRIGEVMAAVEGLERIDRISEFAALLKS
jgi:2-methylcitrate dehydratase